MRYITLLGRTAKGNPHSSDTYGSNESKYSIFLNKTQQDFEKQRLEWKLKVEKRIGKLDRTGREERGRKYRRNNIGAYDEVYLCVQ